MPAVGEKFLNAPLAGKPAANLAADGRVVPTSLLPPPSFLIQLRIRNSAPVFSWSEPLAPLLLWLFLRRLAVALVLDVPPAMSKPWHVMQPAVPLATASLASR